jgi:class 3 adenylate cyclase
VRGSTELSERLDPEEWHRILDRFFQILTEGVHRFEGTVNQYTGDGIMALFGAPIAHEDHAQRACYAALWLRDRLREYTQELRRERGLDFATRMGLNSGEVVVGKIGDDLRMDYAAQGHAVNLGKRMEQLAEAGAVYLTRATADRVRGYFELDGLGPFHRAPWHHRGIRVPAEGPRLAGWRLQVLAQSDLLQTFAEVSAALAGFAALASALSRGRETAPTDFANLRFVVVVALELIGICLLPLLVADAGVPERTVWRSSSAIALLVNWATAYFVLRYMARHRIPLRQPLTLFVLYPAEVIGELALLVNVLGLYAEYASTLYLVFLLIGFAQAAAAFVYFLDAVFAPSEH